MCYFSSTASGEKNNARNNVCDGNDKEVFVNKAQKSPKHEFHENHHSVTVYFIEKNSKQCCDTTTPESIHTKDESKRGSAFAFIFGVN